LLVNALATIICNTTLCDLMLIVGYDSSRRYGVRPWDSIEVESLLEQVDSRSTEC
jgi:hypothetical protein